MFGGYYSSMPKKRSAPAEKKATGRPSKYRPEYDEQVYQLCRLGAIDEDIAEFFKITVTTVNKWKKIHASFVASIKKGKADADREISDSLFKRAKGYVRNIQKEVKLKRVWWEEGKKFEEESVEVVNLKVEEAPDTTAIIFFLKNRRPDLWRDRRELGVGGEKDGEPVGVQIYLPDNQRN